MTNQGVMRRRKGGKERKGRREEGREGGKDEGKGETCFFLAIYLDWKYAKML